MLANFKAQEAVPDIQLSRCPMQNFVSFFSAAEGKVPSSTLYVGALQRIPVLRPGVCALFWYPAVLVRRPPVIAVHCQGLPYPLIS